MSGPYSELGDKSSVFNFVFVSFPFVVKICMFVPTVCLYFSHVTLSWTDEAPLDLTNPAVI